MIRYGKVLKFSILENIKNKYQRSRKYIDFLPVAPLLQTKPNVHLDDAIPFLKKNYLSIKAKSIEELDFKIALFGDSNLKKALFGKQINKTEDIFIQETKI